MTSSDRCGLCRFLFGRKQEVVIRNSGPCARCMRRTGMRWRRAVKASYSSILSWVSSRRTKARGCEVFFPCQWVDGSGWRSTSNQDLKDSASDHLPVGGRVGIVLRFVCCGCRVRCFKLLRPQEHTLRQQTDPTHAGFLTTILDRRSVPLLFGDRNVLPLN